MPLTFNMQTKTNGRSLRKGWRWVKIGDIAEVSTGGTPSTTHPEYYGGDIRWLKSGDVKGTYIDDVPNRITQLGLDNSNARIHPAGSVMLAMSGQGKTRGTSAILRVPSTCSQSVAAILPTEHVIPEIIHYALVNRYEDTRRITGDDERTGLNLKLIREIEIPLPPLDEQRRIASRLNQQLAAVESARKAAEEQLHAAWQLPSAYLRNVFENEETKKWQKRRLVEVAEIGSGITLGRKLNGVETRKVPYLRVANVKDGYLDLSSIYEIDATKADVEKCTLKYGDLLLTEGGDPDKLGRGTFWEEQIPECLHQNHIFRVRFDLDRFFPQFVSYQVGSAYGKAYFLAHAKQTTGIATINQKVLGNFPLLIPSFDDQKQIAETLKNRIADAEKLSASLESQLAEINRLPASLLRGAFAGGG